MSHVIAGAGKSTNDVMELDLMQTIFYFRFQRTPSFESSSRMPFADKSLRIASARAKLRLFFACVRSAMSLSMSASLSSSEAWRVADSLVSLPSCSAQARASRAISVS